MQDEDIDRAVDAAHKVRQQADAARRPRRARQPVHRPLAWTRTSPPTRPPCCKGSRKYNGTDTTGFAAGSHRLHRRHQRRHHRLRRRRHRVQRLNTDRELSPSAPSPRALERVDQRKSHALLLRRPDAQRHRKPGQPARRHQRSRQGQHGHLHRRHPRPAGPAAVGDASKGSLRGTSAYTGSAVAAAAQRQLRLAGNPRHPRRRHRRQGFFDSNDFGPAFSRSSTTPRPTTSSASTPPTRRSDGTFRHLTVKVNRPDVKLEYRPGYYAPADFQHQKTEDRELALTEQLRSDLPATDVAALPAGALLPPERKHVLRPVSLIVPGSQIPSSRTATTTRPTSTSSAQVKNAQGITVGNIRDTVKLALDHAARRQAEEHPVLHRLHPRARTLPPEVRRARKPDRQHGQLRNRPERPRPEEVAAQAELRRARQPARTQPAEESRRPRSIRDGEEWIPNVAHVFRQDQHLYFLYEVYDPTHQKTTRRHQLRHRASTARPPTGGVHVLTCIEFCSDGTKVYETPLVEADQHQRPRPRRRRLPVRRPADASETRQLRLPGERDRRRRRQLQLPAHGAASDGSGDGPARSRCANCSAGSTHALSKAIDSRTRREEDYRT